jgi:hypothetical protein
MTHLLPWLSILACAAMMFGAGAIAWLTTKTPLQRVPPIRRRAACRGRGRAARRPIRRVT